MVRGEPGERFGDRCVRVGVAGHEDVREAVTVHVTHGRARVPAVLGDARRPRDLAEGPVAPVPQQRVVRVRRDVQVRVAVQIDVGRHASVAAQREVRPRAAADVGERPSFVVEEGAAREVAPVPPAGDVLFGVGVDHEQVEPPVGVVVEPAEPPAHHRRGVRRSVREAERPVAEPETHLAGDVAQLRRHEPRRVHLGRRLGGCDGGWVDASRSRRTVNAPLSNDSSNVRSKRSGCDPNSVATAIGGPCPSPGSRVTSARSTSPAGTPEPREGRQHDLLGRAAVQLRGDAHARAGSGPPAGRRSTP